MQERSLLHEKAELIGLKEKSANVTKGLDRLHLSKLLEEDNTEKNGNMKLYLAVATLMLVLIAHSEAVEEPTIEQHFANFQAKLQEFGSDLTEKTTKVLKDFETSEFATNTKNWLNEQFEKVKQKFDEAFNKPE
ncbi:hypothetical protein PDJAM_G00010020 [Pangasius djambal]|uniref:Uncharacterized protein n=1 Tax=Pangasius djambal TaxID=1691987 RepID=A0ACC5XZK3_9TELE|nr:hypothetical protein [Pangasius djambal]